MQVKVKKMFEDVQLPEYATPGSACFDIRAYKLIDGDSTTETFGTGLKFEIPVGHVMLVYSRSGHGFNNDVRLANCVGVIDSDYRGELMVKRTLDKGAFHERQAAMCRPGDKIAQGMIIPYEQVQFVLAEELSSTERGEGGLGSTGV